ncbi:hypothetical protein EDB87DRAFT_1686469 [Lactarius vividus]|nr:hypothetical protein EDB87DRAFT_1686469 [Lactarius vividus]
MDEELVDAGREMVVLEWFLERSLCVGTSSSQFVTVFDIIEDRASGRNRWSSCRLDDSTGSLGRCTGIYRFQQDGGSRVPLEHAQAGSLSSFVAAVRVTRGANVDGCESSSEPANISASAGYRASDRADKALSTFRLQSR